MAAILRQIDREFFYASVRKSIFGGTLTETQVSNMEHILEAIATEEIHNPAYIGAIFATARWEVGANMAPVREGFAKTNQGAINAVTDLFRKGKISRNYALPDPVTGLSYYGRGYPQTTHKENYLKSGQVLGVGDLFVQKPDLLLEPYYAASAMIAMMMAGKYTGKSLPSTLGSGIPTDAQWIASRAVINGDAGKKISTSKNAKTIGQVYMSYAKDFMAAVRFIELPVAPEPEKAQNAPEPQIITITQPDKAPDRFLWWEWALWIITLGSYGKDTK